MSQIDSTYHAECLDTSIAYCVQRSHSSSSRLFSRLVCFIASYICITAFSSAFQNAPCMHHSSRLFPLLHSTSAFIAVIRGIPFLCRIFVHSIGERTGIQEIFSWLQMAIISQRCILLLMQNSDCRAVG
jgi:hypothetical protein